MEVRSESYGSFRARKAGIGDCILMLLFGILACLLWLVVLLIEVLSLIGGLRNAVREIATELRENIQDFILYVFSLKFLRD